MMIFVSFFVEKIIIPSPYRALVVPPKSRINGKSKLHYTNSLSVAVSEPAVYRLITFHVPNLISHFSLLSSYQSIIPGPRQVFTFRKKNATYNGEELSTLRPTPKLEDDHLSAIRNCLFNIFVASLHIGGRSIRNLRNPDAVVTGTHLSRISQ